MFLMMSVEKFDFDSKLQRAMLLIISLQKSLRVPSFSVVPLLQTGKYVASAEDRFLASKLLCTQWPIKCARIQKYTVKI